MTNHRNELSPEDLAEIAAALGEPHRLRLLGMLVHGEQCLCDLTDRIELVSSTVSNHMAILKRVGLVEARKEGRWMHFRLTDMKATTPAATALRWALSHLPASEQQPHVPESGACCP
jgi:ArsR family transcriptional regulator, arsenate/arsenite/antimonite-responsive transcriptional repressor